MRPRHHGERPAQASIWLLAAAACAACHPGQDLARRALPSGPALEVRGAQPTTVTAPAVEAVEKATDELTASCGVPTRFHVAARAASVTDPDGRGWAGGALPWRFRVEPLAGRVLVTACVEPLAQGCVQTHLAELADERWIESAVPTDGLPPLAVVNLLTAPGTPFRRAIHEENAPFGGDPQDVCDYFNMMVGSVSLARLAGEWPDNAWAQVSYLLDHSGLPYEDLYRWDGSRWRLAFSSQREGTYVEAIAPWREGLVAAVVEDAALEPERKLVYLGPGREVRALLPRRGQELRFGVTDGALVALVTERRGGGESTRLLRWSSPRSAPAAQRIAIGADDGILGVVFAGDAVTLRFVRGDAQEDELWRFDRRWVLAERRALGPADAEEEAGDPSACRDLAVGGAGGTALELRTEWRLGDRILLEAGAPGGGETWLLSDRPVESAWEIPPEPLIWPPQPRCPPGEIPEGFEDERGERPGDW